MAMDLHVGVDGGRTGVEEASGSMSTTGDKVAYAALKIDAGRSNRGSNDGRQGGEDEVALSREERGKKERAEDEVALSRERRKRNLHCFDANGKDRRQGHIAAVNGRCAPLTG
jgi:hypothetical protein